MGRKKKPLAPQANKPSVFNRLGLGAASKTREVDANLTVSVRVGTAAPHAANTNAKRKPAATVHQGPPLPGGIDLRARINARKGGREADTPDEGGGQDGRGETRKIGEALASRLGKRKATEAPEALLDREDGGRSSGRKIAISDRSGLPEITIRSPQKVAYRASANHGQGIADSSKRRNVQLGPGSNGVHSQSAGLLLCPLCDVLCTDLADHNRTPSHEREREKQRRTGVFSCKQCFQEFSKQEDLARHVISLEHRERAEQRIRHALEEGGGQPVEPEDRQGGWSQEAGPARQTLKARAGRRDAGWGSGRDEQQEEGVVWRTLEQRESQVEANGAFEGVASREDWRLEDERGGRDVRGGDGGGHEEFQRPVHGSSREPELGMGGESEQGFRRRLISAVEEEPEYTAGRGTSYGARRQPELQGSLLSLQKPDDETRGGRSRKVGLEQDPSLRQGPPEDFDGESGRGPVPAARRETDSPPRQSPPPQKGRANGRAKSQELWERPIRKRKAEYSERMPPATFGSSPRGTEMTGGGALREGRRLADRLETGRTDLHRAEFSQDPSVSVKGPRQDKNNGSWRQEREADEGLKRDGRSRREEDRNRVAGALYGAEVPLSAALESEQDRERAKGREKEERREQRSIAEPEREVFHDAEEGDWPESDVEPIYEEWQEEVPGLETREPGFGEADASGDGFVVGQENGAAGVRAGQDDWLELRLAPTQVNGREGGQRVSAVDREAEDDRWAGGEGLEAGDHHDRQRATDVSRVRGRDERGHGLAEANDSGPPGFQTERTLKRRSELVSTGPEAGRNGGGSASGRTGLFANGREIVNARTGTDQAVPNGRSRVSRAIVEEREQGDTSAAEAAERRSELVRKAVERRAQTGKVIRGELPRGLRAGVIDDEGFDVPVKVQEAVEGGSSLPEIEAPLSMDNYYDKMAMLYHVEEAQMQVSIV